MKKTDEEMQNPIKNNVYDDTVSVQQTGTVYSEKELDMLRKIYGEASVVELLANKASESKENGDPEPDDLESRLNLNSEKTKRDIINAIKRIENKISSISHCQSKMEDDITTVKVIAIIFAVLFGLSFIINMISCAAYF